MDRHAEFVAASMRMARRARNESRSGALAVFACAVATTSCEGEVALARGQALVIVDTDVPIVGQLAEHPELSAAAAIDSVRIDAFRDDGTPEDFLDVVVPAAEDWPLSFGIASAGKSSIRIQIRAFKAAYADRGELNGRDTLEPQPELTIDRVADIPLPSEGVQRVVIRLAGDCLGVRPAFDATAGTVTTCIDGARLAGRPSDAVEVTDELVVPSVSGTWEPAKEKPCAAEDDAGRVCIEGGFMLMGDDTFDGYVDGVLLSVTASPVRPVVMSPFFMDRREMTVGRFEQIAAESAIAPLPRRTDPTHSADRHCTWGMNDPELPLNCVEIETAQQICAAVGGVLPSEAQWEFAARGRGLQHTYPWGEAPPACCSAAARRVPGGVGACDGDGPARVGSFTGADGCDPFDVSRDGVLDLAGNVSELTRDSVASYDDPCWWTSPVLRDPVCAVATVTARTGRGGFWSGGFAAQATPLRQTYYAAPKNGFRCVYAGAP